MTTQNLLTGLKELLETEFEKSGLKFESSEAAFKKPNIYIGFLPVAEDIENLPYIVITLPSKAKDTSENQTLKISLLLGALHNDSVNNPLGFMDILTIADRVREILLRNNIVAGLFKRKGKIRWGIDSPAGHLKGVSSGTINIKYETRSSYMEVVNE